MTFQKGLMALLLCSVQVVSANSFSYTGSFSNDSDVQLFDFSLAADSSAVVINTLSVNGGLNVAGNLIAAGGFNPYLSLWDQSAGGWVFNTSNQAIQCRSGYFKYDTLFLRYFISRKLHFGAESI